MKTQFDHTKRVVALNNLEAMCARISGTCHRFTISKVTGNRVYVEYSNPDEYGNPEPITAVLPAYAAHNNTAVILDAIDYKGCTGRNEEAWQAFGELYDCQQLWRSQDNDGREQWQTDYEILVARNPEYTVTNSWDAGGCIQTYHCSGHDFHSWREAQDWAVEQMKSREQVV